MASEVLASSLITSPWSSSMAAIYGARVQVAQGAMDRFRY